jgi:hypothetical protein
VEALEHVWDFPDKSGQVLTEAKTWAFFVSFCVFEEA